MDHPFQQVYHCSPVQGLTLIAPHISTHGQCWVYATGDRVMASVFLGREGGDFTCGTGMVNGVPYLVERFAGALELRYGGILGSLYTLPGDSFSAGRTTWGCDLVSEEPVLPVSETRVDDAQKYLFGLASEGKILIKMYPDCLPEDDEDLVKRAALGSMGGLKKYHPHLVDRALEAIASGKYER